MKKFLLLFCWLLSGCRASQNFVLPQDWQYQICPDRGSTEGCDIKIPAPKNSFIEAQEGNSILVMPNGDLTIQITAFKTRNFSSSEITACKERKIEGACTRTFRFEKENNDIRIIALGITENPNLFIYYLFTPKNTYFVRGISDKGPETFDFTITNTRLVDADN